MSSDTHNLQHIQVTDAFIHVYLVLAQYLDHILDETKSPELSNQDIEDQLEAARMKLQSAMEANPIVQGKVGEECTRIMGKACMVLKEGKTTKNVEALNAERSMLQTKIVALTDLSAVFRAI